MTPFICTSKNGQNYRIECELGFAKVDGWRRHYCQMMREFLGGDGNVLCSDCGIDYTAVHIWQNYVAKIDRF